MGLHRAILFSGHEGWLEIFRPCAPPDETGREEVRRKLGRLNLSRSRSRGSPKRGPACHQTPKTGDQGQDAVAPGGPGSGSLTFFSQAQGRRPASWGFLPTFSSVSQSCRFGNTLGCEPRVQLAR
jgi:hypothetical protein